MTERLMSLNTKTGSRDAQSRTVTPLHGVAYGKGLVVLSRLRPKFSIVGRLWEISLNNANALPKRENTGFGWQRPAATDVLYALRGCPI